MPAVVIVIQPVRRNIRIIHINEFYCDLEAFSVGIGVAERQSRYLITANIIEHWFDRTQWQRLYINYLHLFLYQIYKV